MADTKDYADRDARHHHEFYIPTGDIIFQAEKAIFRVHSHFLTTQSNVFNDMLAAPKDQTSNDGTDISPLFLAGDRVEGWELLLSAFYRRNPLKPIKYTSKESIAVLRITHKYCMDIIEEDILSGLILKQATNTAGLIDLMVASKVVDSSPLYKMALKGLISSHPKPTLEEAMLIGLEAYHAIISGSSTNINSKPCNRCSAVGRLSVYCQGCCEFQLL